MRFHPDVLACHAQFGGDLEDMQRRYDAAPAPEKAAPIPADAAKLANDLLAIANASVRADGSDIPIGEICRKAAIVIADRASQEERITRADLASLLEEVLRPSASPKNHLRQIGVMIERMMAAAGSPPSQDREPDSQRGAK